MDRLWIGDPPPGARAGGGLLWLNPAHPKPQKFLNFGSSQCVVPPPPSTSKLHHLPSSETPKISKKFSTNIPNINCCTIETAMIPPDRHDKLPPWISDSALAIARQNHALNLEVEKQSFAIAYEQMLEAVSSGTNLTAFCRTYHMPISPTRYRAWLLRDPQRNNAFRLAQKIGAESIEDDLIRIADGLDADGRPTLDDVARSKLKIDTRKYVLQVQDKDRYGDVKQVNSTIVTIDEEKARSMTTSEIKAMLVKRLSETSIVEDVLDNMATQSDNEDSNDDADDADA